MQGIQELLNEIKGELSLDVDHPEKAQLKKKYMRLKDKKALCQEMVQNEVMDDFLKLESQRRSIANADKLL